MNIKFECVSPSCVDKPYFDGFCFSCLSKLTNHNRRKIIEERDVMSNVKPHFECSGYGCNDCTKGVIIEEPEIKDSSFENIIPNYFYRLATLHQKIMIIRAMIKNHNIESKRAESPSHSIQLITVDGKRGYFVEIEE